jgi:hypothetical protein
MSWNRQLRRHPFAPRLVLLGAFFLLVTSALPALGQSCILTRLDSPVVDAFDPSIAKSLEETRWEVSLGYRYGVAERHFVGTEEQKHRREENSQVENHVHLFDIGVSYRLNTQSEVTVGIPYLMARREGPLRYEGEVIGRTTRSNTRGIGDIAVTYNRLFWDPETHPRSNLALGIGIELPTGDTNQIDARFEVNDDGEIVPAPVTTADQSVQPGDGGFGFILQASGYGVLNESGTFAFYGSGTYIIAPETDNGVPTFRSRAGEEVMSIADQYAGRLGLQYAFGQKGWSAGLGARVEGIPVHDLFGSSKGFRRPGYILSVEPSATWSRGNHTFTVSVPVAVERNRQRSVPDLANGHHGDASFPDYIVLMRYARRL